VLFLQRFPNICLIIFTTIPNHCAVSLNPKSSVECLLFERECTFYTFHKRHRRGRTGPVFLRGGADVCEISKIAVAEAEIAGDSLGVGWGGTFARGASKHICIGILIVVLLIK